MILLWGVEQDPPIMMVRQALADRGIPHFFLDHKQLWRTHIDISFGEIPTGFIELNGRRIDVEEITAAYLRPYNYLLYPTLTNAPARDRPEMQHRAGVSDDILWAWAEVAPGRMLNRPSAMLSNNSKPYQTMLIERAGFKVPDTILTNSTAYAKEYLEREPEVIYKSISSVRSIVSRVGEEKRQSLGDVRNCPVQFQRCVAGTDCRVHVIGEKVFATHIMSTADDYRYSKTDHEALALSPAQEQRLVALSQAMELPLCGADFRRTPEGEWICFEVNPSPAYSYYEGKTGQNISGAIADYLSASPPLSSRPYTPLSPAIPALYPAYFPG